MLGRTYSYFCSIFVKEYEHNEEQFVCAAREIKEEKLSKDIKTVKGIGVLLDNNSEKCSISGEFDFKRSDFFGAFSTFKNHDEIIFEAKRCSSDNNWVVTSVKPYKDSLAEKEKRRLQVFVTMVDRANVREDFIVTKGGLDREQYREIDRSLLDFKPQKGDFLRLTLKFDGIIVLEGEYFPQRVAGFPVHAEPTKRIECTGTVTKKHNSLCVDNKIYFEFGVVEGNKRLLEGDKVSVTAVESQQNPFSWRALKVKLEHRDRDRNDRRLNSWDEQEENNNLAPESPMARLFETKAGVSIAPESCLVFENTPVGETSYGSLTITIEVMSPMPILRKVYTFGDQNVCVFSVTVRDSGDIVHNFENNAKCVINVSCSPKVMGRTKDLVKFEFDTFVCARYLEVLAVPPSNDQIWDEHLQPPLHYESRTKERLSEKATIQKIQQSHLVKAVPGIKPFRQAFFQARKMPHYMIPDNLWAALESKDNNVMNMNYSFAQQLLSFENFVQKFDLCLWLEEISVNLKLRQYDIRVKMNPAGQLNGHPKFVLPLPNYPDITSILHCGDRLVITIPDAAAFKGEKSYEGYVNDVAGSDIFVAFDVERNENLRYKYDNEIVKVDFSVSRSRYKCDHFAVESAVQYLGEPFLFPSEQHIIVKPARILFEEMSSDEDKQDEHQTTVLKNPSRVKGLPEPVLGTIASRWNTRAKSLREIQPHDEINTKPNGNVLKWVDGSLNEEQKNAVRRILRGQARPLPYIIFGPPGTGKTVTVVEAIIQIFALDPNSRILVSAPSNSAADLIAQKLLSSGCFVPGDFIRLLGFMRAERAKYSEELKPFLRTAEELDLVTKHRIIVSTTSSTSKFTQVHLNDGYFTHVFIDEAGYCHEPEALLPCILVTFNRGGQVILAGDPNQLGPVITSKYATMCGLSQSFLERLMSRPIYSRDEERFPDTKYNPLLITKLLKNYRAHSTLLKMPSKLFYEDELVACADETNYELCSDERFLKAKILVKLNVPLVFRGIQGISGRRNGLKTWTNEYEAALVVEYVRKLLHLGIDKEDIGIITPYTGQVEEIKFQYQRTEESLDDYNGPKVGSVEEFQGGERKVILYSTVRSGSEKDLKKTDFTFVLNAKRFNVSITRPKSLLIVIGNPHVLVQDTNWSQFIEYAVEIGAYSGCDLPLELDKKAQSVIKSITTSNNEIA